MKYNANINKRGRKRCNPRDLEDQLVLAQVSVGVHLGEKYFQSEIVAFIKGGPERISNNSLNKLREFDGTLGYITRRLQDQSNRMQGSACVAEGEVLGNN